MAQKRPFKQVRIDQDLYDFFVEYAAGQPGYVSAAQVINSMLRQAVRAAGVSQDESRTVFSIDDTDD